MPLLLYEIENGLLSRPARLAARLLYLTVHSVLTDRYIQYAMLISKYMIPIINNGFPPALFFLIRIAPIMINATGSNNLIVTPKILFQLSPLPRISGTLSRRTIRKTRLSPIRLCSQTRRLCKCKLTITRYFLGISHATNDPQASHQ